MKIMEIYDPRISLKKKNPSGAKEIASFDPKRQREKRIRKF